MTSPSVLITGALAGIGRATAVAFAPGPTDMIVRFAGGLAAAQSLGRSLPIQRLGQVDEIAAAIVFAAIGKSRFMTGHSISVDGLTA